MLKYDLESLFSALSIINQSIDSEYIYFDDMLVLRYMHMYVTLAVWLHIVLLISTYKIHNFILGGYYSIMFNGLL